MKGNLLTIIAMKKIAMRSGETDIADIIENHELTKIGEKISLLSRHIGNLDVDCFLVDDKFYILEMNCRLGGQYPFCHLAGTNFPLAIIKMIQQQVVPNDALIAKKGIRGYKDIYPVIFK